VGRRTTVLAADRDGIYGADFTRTVQGMDIDEVLTAPRSPWQNPFVERVMARFAASAWTT
jgi:putative transposase